VAPVVPGHDRAGEASLTDFRNDRIPHLPAETGGVRQGKGGPGGAGPALDRNVNAPGGDVFYNRLDGSFPTWVSSSFQVTLISARITPSVRCTIASSNRVSVRVGSSPAI